MIRKKKKATVILWLSLELRLTLTLTDGSTPFHPELVREQDAELDILKLGNRLVEAQKSLGNADDSGNSIDLRGVVSSGIVKDLLHHVDLVEEELIAIGDLMLTLLSEVNTGVDSHDRLGAHHAEIRIVRIPLNAGCGRLLAVEHDEVRSSKHNSSFPG